MTNETTDQGWAAQDWTSMGYTWTCRGCEASGWSAMGQASGGYEHTSETGHTTETATEATAG